MTNDVYVKAEEIQKKIKEFEELRYITTKPYKKYGLIKKFLWISDYDKQEVCLCDKGLTELIRDYCDKRIRKLREELAAL